MPSRCLRSLVPACPHRCLGDDCTWTTPHPNHTTRIHMHAYTQPPTNINRATPQTVLSIGLLPSLPKTYMQRRKHGHVLALLPCTRLTPPPASIAAPRSCVLLVEWSEMGIGVRCNVEQHKHADESPGLPPRHSHVHVHVHLQPHHKTTALPSLPRTPPSPRSYADMHMYSRVHTHAATHAHTHRHTHTPHPIRCPIIECGTYQAGRWRRGTRWRRLPPRGRRDRSKGRRRRVTAGTTATAPRRRMALAGACEGGGNGCGKLCQSIVRSILVRGVARWHLLTPPQQPATRRGK